MKSIKFKLPVPPFSINQMYYRDQRIKTTEARRWTESIFRFISSTDLETKFAELRSKFDPKRNSFGIRITAFYPEKRFKNKEGTVSSKTIDVSNFEKPLIDLLFLPKYYAQPAPDGFANLNCDDKFITAMISEKRSTKLGEPYLEVRIWIRRHR